MLSNITDKTDINYSFYCSFLRYLQEEKVFKATQKFFIKALVVRAKLKHTFGSKKILNIKVRIVNLVALRRKVS